MMYHNNTTHHAIKNQPVRSGEQLPVRAAFTLLEMLVAIVLVLLIMLMFSSIFEVVGNTMSAQKGIAVNDQKARTVLTILREDVKNRTFRRVFPFAPGQNTAKQPGPFYSPGDRQGYFSISENDVDNPTDDVLAFTVRYDAPISMKATVLNAIPFPALDMNQNQPVFDDGIPDNGAGSSFTTEVVYFLRNGNLYRRVMLIREPYDDPTDEGVQPGELDADYNLGTNHFWRDFDYSAYRDVVSILGSNPGPKFHGPDSLNNDSQTAGEVRVDVDDTGISTSSALAPASLGVPFLRFGHSPSLAFGKPREFVKDANGNSFFIGRFTQQETANSKFAYPGNPSANGDIFINPNLRVLNTFTGLVDGLDTEIFRRGEDILLSNVHEFNIEVWDDYDEIDLDRDGNLDANEDFNSNGERDSVMAFVNLGHNRTQPLGNPANQPIGYYNGTEFTTVSGTTVTGVVLGQNSNTNYGNRYDTWHPFVDTSGGSPLDLGVPPYRPLSPFNGEDRAPGTFQDDDLDLDTSLTDPEEQGWLGSDDEVPLKAIRITLRFFDVTSDQMRQLTIVLKLTD